MPGSACSVITSRYRLVATQELLGVWRDGPPVEAAASLDGEAAKKASDRILVGEEILDIDTTNPS